MIVFGFEIVVVFFVKIVLLDPVWMGDLLEDLEEFYASLELLLDGWGGFVGFGWDIEGVLIGFHAAENFL